MAPAQVVALEDLCVLKLIGEVEHYSLAQLVLLPWHLRQKLLRSLPLADICRLETNSLLTRGIDMDAVWGEVCTRFLDLLSPQDNVPGGAYLVRFEQLARPKDTVMAMIAKLLLISTTGIMATAYALRLCTPEYTTLSRGQKAGIQHFQDKWGIIRTLLFCSHHLSIDDVSVSMNGNSMESFVHIKLFPTIPSWQPKRHSIHFNTRLTSIAEMSEMFLSVCNAVPKVLRFHQHDSIENLKLKSPESKLILQSILSGIEEFSIDRSLPQKVPFCSASLQQVFEAVTSPSTASLKSLRIKGVPFFLKELIQDIAAYLAPQINSPNQLESAEEDLKVQGDGLSGYTNLRKFEFLSCHPEEREVVDMQRDEPICLLSTAIPSLLGILNSQAQLKEVHIDHLYDLTKEGVRYDGFGSLYSSLRHFIRSPHFRFLRIANCHIPLRIAQQLLDTFAHCLTTHPTTLDISKCSFDVTFSRYFSRVITEEDHHRISSTQYSLCEKQHKSLAIPYGIFSNTIALPKVQYERLQISVVDDDIRLLDLIEYIGNFEPQPKVLDIHILSYSPTRKDLGAVNKILALPHLTNFGVGDLGCETCELLDHLASALGEHSSTANTLQGLSLFITAETAASSYQQVYEAVFSLPQLEKFSLELIFDLKNCRHHFKYLTEAWRATSRGGKLLNLTGLELDENSVNDFVGVGRQIAEKVRAFDKFYQ
jgi:hypothetical protein